AGKFGGVEAALQYILLLGDGLQRDAVQAVQDRGAVPGLQHVPELPGAGGVVALPIGQLILGGNGQFFPPRCAVSAEKSRVSHPSLQRSVRGADRFAPARRRATSTRRRRICIL